MWLPAQILIQIQIRIHMQIQVEINIQIQKQIQIQILDTRYKILDTDIRMPVVACGCLWLVNWLRVVPCGWLTGCLWFPVQMKIQIQIQIQIRIQMQIQVEIQIHIQIQIQIQILDTRYKMLDTRY